MQAEMFHAQLSVWILAQSWLAAVLWFELWPVTSFDSTQFVTSWSLGVISGLISIQRFVVSEDWTAPRGLLQIVSVCVWVTETERNDSVCHIQPLCFRCTCMSAGLGKLCSDVSFLCFSGVFGLSFPCLSAQHYVAAVSISTNNSFILSTTGNYRLEQEHSVCHCRSLWISTFLRQPERILFGMLCSSIKESFLQWLTLSLSFRTWN